MVLAVVDDLLFSSKIRAAAGATATTVVFVRKRDAVLAVVRAQHPTQVILDLDRDALDPIGLIREIRSAPELAAIQLIGFASHVHADRLQEARTAGCDRVMARSGFVAALPDLLQPAIGQASLP